MFYPTHRNISINWSVWLLITGFMRENKWAFGKVFPKKWDRSSFFWGPLQQLQQNSHHLPVAMPVMGYARGDCSPYMHQYSLGAVLEDISIGLVVQSAQKSCPGDQGGISSPLPLWMYLMHFRCTLGRCMVWPPFQYSVCRKSDTRVSCKHHPGMGYFSKCPRELMAWGTEGDAFQTINVGPLFAAERWSGADMSLLCN